MGRVERFFNEYAHDFDAIYGGRQGIVGRLLNPVLRKSMRVRYEKSIAGCDPIEGRTALDIGCGPGHYAIALARRGAKRVVGIDFAGEMIRIAREKAAEAGVSPVCEFLVGDIFGYEPEHPFDYAILMGLMDYIEDPAAMVRKVISLTTGRAFFSFPAEGGILAWQRKLRYRSRCPLYLYTERRIERLFEGFAPHRFEIERIHRDFFVTLHIRADMTA